MSEEAKIKVRRFIEQAWNNGDMSVIDELFAGDYVLHEPHEDIEGPQGMREMVEGFRGAFPDIHCTVEDQMAEGDLVATRWSLSATHQGEMMGVAPTGKRIAIDGIVIHRFVAGTMAEAWDRWDWLGFMQQLGAMPQLEATEA
jgi:steroid delta-isomerase-like uncharacterized protein